MGWASGSGLMFDIIEDIERHTQLSEVNKLFVYAVLIENFENHDCDTLDECCGDNSDLFTQAYESIHPPEDD